MRNRRGMTIIELLVAIIILGLMTAGLTTAVSLGVSQFSKSMRTSESQQLFSSIETTLDNELRYTWKFTDSNNVEYQRDSDSMEKLGTAAVSVSRIHSNTYGDSDDVMSRVIMLDADGKATSSAGQIAFQNTKGTIFRLLGKTAYNYDLVASVKNLKYQNGYFSYTLSIYQSGQSTPIISQTVNVRALNMSNTSDSTKVG